VFNIDDATVGGGGGADSAAGGAGGSALAGMRTGGGGGTDAICCIAASTKMLLVARESGVVQQYSLPMVTLENKHQLRCRPATIQLNCDSTRFSVIDINNVLTLFDLEARVVNAAGVTVQGEHLAFEKKDVWVRDDRQREGGVWMARTSCAASLPCHCALCTRACVCVCSKFCGRRTTRTCGL